MGEEKDIGLKKFIGIILTPYKCKKKKWGKKNWNILYKMKEKNRKDENLVLIKEVI